MRRDVQFLLDRVSFVDRLGLPVYLVICVLIAALASPLFEPIWSGPRARSAPQAGALVAALTGPDLSPQPAPAR